MLDEFLIFNEERKKKNKKINRKHTKAKKKIRKNSSTNESTYQRTDQTNAPDTCDENHNRELFSLQKFSTIVTTLKFCTHFFGGKLFYTLLMVVFVQNKDTNERTKERLDIFAFRVLPTLFLLSSL